MVEEGRPPALVRVFLFDDVLAVSRVDAAFRIVVSSYLWSCFAAFS